jgi:hypothetical protein
LHSLFSLSCAEAAKAPNNMKDKIGMRIEFFIFYLILEPKYLIYFSNPRDLQNNVLFLYPGIVLWGVWLPENGATPYFKVNF